MRLGVAPRVKTGQVFLDTNKSDPNANFGVCLHKAINDIPAEGSIIDCRGVNGAQSKNDAVNMNKAVIIVLRQMVCTTF